MPTAFTFPRKWSREELKAARNIAEDKFRQDRQDEGPRLFYKMYRAVELEIREVMAETNDLQELTGALFRKMPMAWRTLRYFCAPPISEEDLWTFVGRKFKSVPADAADDTAEAFLLVLDEIRLKWLAEKRSPSTRERESAVMATTALLAHERLKTSRRGVASRSQEEEVATILRGIGLAEDHGQGPILVLDRLPRGTFSRERKVDGSKCDVPVRLNDGRLLGLECKVSNGPKNS